MDQGVLTPKKSLDVPATSFSALAPLSSSPNPKSQTLASFMQRRPRRYLLPAPSPVLPLPHTASSHPRRCLGLMSPTSEKSSALLHGKRFSVCFRLFFHVCSCHKGYLQILQVLHVFSFVYYPHRPAAVASAMTSDTSTCHYCHRNSTVAIV